VLAFDGFMILVPSKSCFCVALACDPRRQTVHERQDRATWLDDAFTAATMIADVYLLHR
jgi:hypothetical protein